MKAISLWQPWASLVVLGAKKVETRSWACRHRGLLAIHASKMWSKVQERTCEQEPFASSLAGPGQRYEGRPEVYGHILPRGCLIGSVLLVDCLPVEYVEDGDRVLYSPLAKGLPFGRLTVTKTERLLGDYNEGRWAWVLHDPRSLPCPIQFPGALSLFDVPDVSLS